MSTLTLFLLFLAGFSGGFIDAVAGGGGLITMPALLACGLTPQMALGTNKLQSSCGTTLAVVRYARAGLMKAPWLWLAVAAALIASAGGALAVSALDKALLKKLMPWMLAAVAVYTALNPRFGLHEGRRKRWAGSRLRSSSASRWDSMMDSSALAREPSGLALA